MSAVLLVSLVLAYYAMREACRYASILCVDVHDGANSDDEPIDHFLDFVNDAREKMIIYDDCDPVEGSIYNNEKVIEAVRNKLERNKNFTMKCYFNCDTDDMRFRKAFDKNDQVEIYLRQGGRDSRPDDVHFKIMDNRKLHLSRHGLGESERRFRVVDCTEVPLGRGQQYASREIIGKFLSEFEAQSDAFKKLQAV